MNIGIVLAGGMSKGAYEIGCLKAISERFSADNIKFISASSIGALSAYAFSTQKLDALTAEWKKLKTEETGSFFPSFSGNSKLMGKLCDLVCDDDSFMGNVYATVWNYSEKKAEYILFNQLSAKERQDYLCAAVAIPIFGKGVRINGCTYFDGAFIDNIPVYPLLDAELDCIFCIYFDGCDYFFENEDFNNKIIKLYRFPSKGRFENFVFDPNKIDNMIEFGYKYTSEVIEKIFSSDDAEAIRGAIKEFSAESKSQSKKRLTGDVLLRSINKMTQHFAKRKKI